MLELSASTARLSPTIPQQMAMAVPFFKMTAH